MPHTIVDFDKSGGLTREIADRAFSPAVSWGNATWGVAPGWYKAAPLALLLALVSVVAQTQAQVQTQAPTQAQAQTHQIKIRIINAKTNQPIHDERLNVALRVDQIGSVAMPTDKNGIILVDTGQATIIRILSNMYADCRSRGELYTNYSIATILSSGITTGNLCSDARPTAKPGELILFEIPKDFIPTMPHPPADTLPHSN